MKVYFEKSIRILAKNQILSKSKALEISSCERNWISPAPSLLAFNMLVGDAVYR